MTVSIVDDYMLRFTYRAECVFVEFKCHSVLTTNCRFACQVRRLSHIDSVNGFQSRIHGGTIIFYDLLLYALGKVSVLYYMNPIVSKLNLDVLLYIMMVYKYRSSSMSIFWSSCSH